LHVKCQKERGRQGASEIDRERGQGNFVREAEERGQRDWGSGACNCAFAYKRSNVFACATSISIYIIF